MKIDDIDFEAIEREYMTGAGELTPCVMNLSVADRRMIILYSELRSYRKLSKIYNCSHNLVYRNVIRISNELKKHINR